jgi:hypothetical protein
VLPLPNLLLHVLEGQSLFRVLPLLLLDLLHTLLLGPNFSQQIMLSLIFTVFTLLS